MWKACQGWVVTRVPNSSALGFETHSIVYIDSILKFQLFNDNKT